MKQFELIRMERGEEKERHPVSNEETIIGRSNDANIFIDGKSISRRHVRLWTDGASVSVEDMGSRNGFKINGVRVRSGHLHLGDMLDVGPFIFLLSDSENAHKKIKAATSADASAPQAGPPRYQAAQFQNDDVRMKAALGVAGKLQPYILDLDKLVAKMGMSVLQSVPAQRCFFLARIPGQSILTVLGSQHAKGGGNGPSVNRTAIEYVDRDGEGYISGDVADEKEASGRGDSTGILCVPFVGRKKRFGVIYVDTGFNPSRFVKSNLEDLKALGRAFGITLETAFQLESQAGAARTQGQAEASEGFARLLEHHLDSGGDAAALRSLIENARAYARVEALEVAPINAAPIVEEVLKSLEGAAQTAGVSLQYEPAPRLIAQADSGALSTILLNLLRNAIQSGGKEVTLRAVNEGKKCIIEVVDNGSGIRTERAVRFSSDLSQMDSKRAAGLGLATVHRLVQAHNGTIEFQKRPRGGTHVRVTLSASS